MIHATATHTATINDRTVDVRPGETILTAAQRAGIWIPTLCHSPGLAPEGGCRICMVEIEGQRTQAACHTPITNGMRIRTESAHLDALRREILHLTISANPRGALQARADGSPMERLLARYGVESSDFGHHGTAHSIDASHPSMRFDRDRCITCRACLHACEEVQGQFVYGIEGRGGASRLIFGSTERFAESGCVSCGACVDRCPTGAITDRDRVTARDVHLPVDMTDSVCGYCGVGCRIRAESDGHDVLRIAGVRDAAVNHGHLCVKGRYNHGYRASSDRLTKPLLKNADGTFREASWDEAIRFTAERLLAIRDAHGPDSLGTMTSSRSTNEAAYLLQKLFRAIIGTNNTDCCARVCHSSTAIALGTVTGTGAATASYDDLNETKLIVIAGANATEAHPVVGARIKQAILRGAACVVIDPREIELAQYAGVHCRLWPGTNVPLFHAIAKVLVEEKLYDEAYVRDRCEGFEELKAFLGSHTLESLSAITHVPVETIRAAARLIGRSGPGLFVSGLGLSEQTQGVAGVMSYCNLGLLTGSLGKRGSGMLPLRGQNNVQGNADMGSQPYSLTGYASLSDPTARERCFANWGTEPPKEIGKTIPEMYDAAIDGSLKALWIQGEDVAQSDPNQDHVKRALGSLDLLIVQELFMTETAEAAHVVFPAASSLEQEGTFTNGERRVQHVRPSVAPPGGARPDWEVIRDVAISMGARWRYDTPGAVMDEVARVAPNLFGGISYERLEGDGIQWPCPAPDHPGTRTVHSTSFVRGRGLFTTVDFVPPQDATDAEHPFVLITGRVLEHYNVGTMTRRGPSVEIVPKDYLELHPEDAARMGIRDDAPVRVRSRFGEAVAPARLTRRVLPGTAFLTFHFPETGTNRVVGPYTDPKSKCPDYKVVAVRVAAV
jgi:formate dehydrogenase major subunit